MHHLAISPEHQMQTSCQEIETVLPFIKSLQRELWNLSPSLRQVCCCSNGAGIKKYLDRRTFGLGYMEALEESRGAQRRLLEWDERLKRAQMEIIK